MLRLFFFLLIDIYIECYLSVNCFILIFVGRYLVVGLYCDRNGYGEVIVYRGRLCIYILNRYLWNLYEFMCIFEVDYLFFLLIINIRM